MAHDAIISAEHWSHQQRYSLSAACRQVMGRSYRLIGGLTGRLNSGSAKSQQISATGQCRPPVSEALRPIKVISFGVAIANRLILAVLSAKCLSISHKIRKTKIRCKKKKCLFLVMRSTCFFKNTLWAAVFMNPFLLSR